VTSPPFPSLSCDTHVHFYDSRFTASDQALLRPPDAGLAEYSGLQRTLGLERVVVVQPTTYGLDNRCQLEAVGEFGNSARAVVVVDETTEPDELARLTELGARGARFHMLPGGAVPWRSMTPVASRIAEHGWHVQLQLNGRDLPDHVDELLALPVDVVVDHIGRYMPPVGPNDTPFRSLLTLLESGRCWVKLSAPYESTTAGAPLYPTVGALVEHLVSAAPSRLLWASNWPHPGQAEPPNPEQLRHLASTWLPDEGLRRRVLVDNPATLYGFPTLVPTRTTTQEPS